MGKKITEYPNNVSTNPDDLSLMDLSEKTGLSTFESRKWTLTAFKAWVNSWVVAGSVAWNNITGKPNVVDTTGGTPNYVAKFTDSNTIEESLIQDDGTTLGVGVIPSSTALVKLSTSTIQNVFEIFNTKAYGQGIYILVSGAGGIGAEFQVNGTTGSPIGFKSSATGVGATKNIGGYFGASGGANNYGLRIVDGTEGAGKFLKSVTAYGEANWENITASDVSGAVGGSGTNNYVARFTPNGNTIGNSLIQDDGTNIGIDSTIESNIKIKSSATTPIGFRMIQSSNNLTNIGIQGFSNGVTNGSNTGVYGTANASVGSNVGVYGTSYGAADTNAGIQGSSTGASKNYGIYGTAEGPTGINIGGYFSSLNGSSNYSVQLQDGTQAIGKILKSVTGDGKANWANFPCEVQLAVSDETTALTTGTGKITFRMPYAMTVTEVRASLVTAQTSGSIFTVDINESGSSIISTKLTIDNTEKTSTTATTPAVISDSSLADDAEITVDIDQIGDGTAKGLKILIKGYRVSW